MHSVPAAVDCERRDGSITLRNPLPLQKSWDTVPAVLDHWAEKTPEAPFLCERSAGGTWRRKRYGEVRDQTRLLARQLLALGCSAERPVMLIAPNSIRHAEINLAAQLIGAPVCPVSLAYATATRDFERLRTMIGTIAPAAILFADPIACAAAIEAVKDLAPTLLMDNHPDSGIASLSELAPAEMATLDAAAAAVGPHSVARLLFTSGSTGKPKAVINTQHMLCANQAMLQQVWPMLTERPPVLVDWLPWSHTFGGNFTFGIALFNGGAFHIDGGKPLPGQFETTFDNLAEVCPTLYFNVPAAYAGLLPLLQKDRERAARVFSRLDFLFCAAAALPQATRDALVTLVRETTGRDIPIYSGWGSTETAPGATMTWFDTAEAGNIGLPLPGVEVRLTPEGEKLELRVRGPIVTPGYWHDEHATAAAFDADGFYRMGDAGKLIDTEKPELGILFDGRVAENFKLSSGTWVSVGALRLAIVNSARPYVQDIAIAGHNRDEIGILIFLNHAACRELVGDSGATSQELARHPAVADQIRSVIRLHNEGQGGSGRIARMLLLEDSPSVERYEITDKGYLNQQAVLSARAECVTALYFNENCRV